MHNGGCVEKETNYHFNCVIRLGKLPFVLFAQIMFFSGSFFHIVGMGNGMIDLWDLATWTALCKNSSVKWPKCLSGWNSDCVWVWTLSFFPLRIRSQGFNEAKYQLGGWIYCCSIVQHKCYLSLLLQQGRFQSRATNTWQEIFPRGQFTFPWQVTMWRHYVWGEPLTSLPLIRKPASGTRASNGGRKISTKTIRKKRLLVVVISWNLAW